MPRKYFPGKKVARKRKTVPRMSFDKRVLSVFNKQRELKVAKLEGSLNVLGDITGISVLKIMPSVPQVGNTGASTKAQEFYRDGNSITLKKIVIRGWITQTPDIQQSRSRYVVRHMILRQRSANATQVLDNNGADFKSGQLLENSSSFIGDIPSLQTPVNKSAFVTRYDKRHYLSSPTNISETSSIDADQVNSFKMIQKTLTFGKGKKLNYGTGGSEDSQDFPYFMTLGASTVDGIPADANITFNYVATAYFFDS